MKAHSGCRRMNFKVKPLCLGAGVMSHHCWVQLRRSEHLCLFRQEGCKEKGQGGHNDGPWDLIWRKKVKEGKG